MKTFEFTPVLGWSASRYDLFNTCKRQYYYNYYGKYDKEFGQSKIQFLKSLTSVPLETGSIFHDIMETLLKRLIKSEKKINLKKFHDYLYQKTLDIVSTKIFSEIYYKETEKIDVQNLFFKVKSCFDQFLNHERFQWLLEEALLNKHSWIIEPPGYGETRIGGLKAYCKVDFLFPVKDKVVIVDWKTGKKYEEKHKKQLLGYAAWAAYHFDKKGNDIETIAVYLFPEYQEMKIVFSDEEIYEFAAVIEKETKQMYQYCLNVEENIPLDKENFPLTEKSFFCGYCNYREFCFNGKGVNR